MYLYLDRNNQTEEKGHARRGGFQGEVVHSHELVKRIYLYEESSTSQVYIIGAVSVTVRLLCQNTV